MKRVLLVVDSHKWCFGHMARGIQKYAPTNEYMVVVRDSTEFHYMQKTYPQWKFDYDAICQFAWSEATYGLPLRSVVVVAHEGFMWPYPPAVQDGYLPLLSTPNRNSISAFDKLPKADRVIFFTEHMRNEAADVLDDTVTLSPAIDRDIFSPIPKHKGSHLQVGWCAQPCPTKGSDLLESVIQECKNQRLRIDFQRNDTRASDDTVKSPEEMADWYRGLDVFLCTAASEGGPLPVLEALACGIPVISTPVGVAKDVASFVVPQCQSREEVPEATRSIVNALQDIQKLTAPEKLKLGRAAHRASLGWETESRKWLQAIAGDGDD